MTNPEAINPESLALQQQDGHWQKICAMLVHKLGHGLPVHLTLQDIQAFGELFPGDLPCLVTHGHPNSFEYYVTSMSEGQRLARRDNAPKGPLQ